MIQITLPALESGAAEAIVEHFYPQIGERVAVGQPLAIVRTARLVWDVPAAAAGTIAEFAAEPGDTLPIGAPLAMLDETAESPAPEAIAEPTESLTPEAIAEPTESLTPEVARIRATPLARRIAAAHRIDVATIDGSGFGGTVMRADVMRIVSASAGDVAVETRAPIEPARDRSAEAPPSIPAFTLAGLQLPHAITAIEVDLSAVDALVAREQAQAARRGIELSSFAVVTRAVVAELTTHRLLNSVWSDDGAIVRGRIDLAIGDRAVIRNAGDLNVRGLVRAMARGDSGGDGATFTIEQSRSPFWSEALARPRQTATLSVGAAARRPVVITCAGRDDVAIRPICVLTLIYDARVIDQPQADAFLCAVKRRLEQITTL